MSTAPRVLVLSHLFPTATDPVLGCFVHEQVRALRREQGIEARVVSFRPFPLNRLHPGRWRRNYQKYRKFFLNLSWEEYDGVPVLQLPYLVGSFLRFFCLHGASVRASLRRALPFLDQTFSYDLIHAHTAYLDGGAACWLSQRRGVPYVLTEHTGPFSSLTQQPWIRWQTRRALAQAQRVWCVSSALAAEVSRLLPAERRSRLSVLANGVDLEHFRPPARWAPNPQAPHLLAILALEPNKAPLLLLRAFAQLRRQVPAARLTLVGSGPLEGEVRGFLAQQGWSAPTVRLLGKQPRREVARLLRDEADLLVLCSYVETFGVVLLEALASGKPVVATDCGGPRDILTTPAVGRLCPVGDAQALAQALAEVVQALPQFDPAFLRRTAERFSLSRLAATLAEEYRQCLAGMSAHGAARAA